MKAIVLATMMLLALGGVASAAQCKPGQVNGRWAAYASLNGFWEECLFVVRSGDLSGQCRQTYYPWFKVAGTLKVSRSCRLSGSIWETGSGSFNELIFGTLQSNGLGGAGVMTDLPGSPINSAGAHFSLVRRP